MASGDLHRYFLNNFNKPVSKWVHYFDVYERHFERFRGKPITMLEIGVFDGGSLAMWKWYFGDQAKIVGLDINPECKAHEAEGIEVFIGSQDDPEVIEKIFEKYPDIDIVLDDGSHVMKHLIASFEMLYYRIAEDGVYMVEDAHTCYWRRYGGGLGRPGTFIEYSKGLIDAMNAVHTRGRLAISDFTRATDSMAFYDSMIVFEKRPQGLRQVVTTSLLPPEQRT
ncbi:MAG: CmcI family methyltransferase [Pseudomonadota bacterium]